MLFPSIYLHWKKYQAVLIEKAKQLKDGVVLAGDGCHDSMGHSAKFCAYTIFCCTFAQIIHFDLVQVGRMKCIILTILIELKLYSLIIYFRTYCTFVFLLCREIKQAVAQQWSSWHSSCAWTTSLHMASLHKNFHL